MVELTVAHLLSERRMGRFKKFYRRGIQAHVSSLVLLRSVSAFSFRTIDVSKG